MTIRLSPLKTLIAALALVVAVPGLAWAANPFTDVPDGQFYTEAVDWAFNNGITTGTTATTFSPDANVTRAENITFAWRYDDLIVQPALDDRYTKSEVYTKAEVDAAVAAAMPATYHASVNADGTTRTGTTTGVTIAKTGTGFYEVELPPSDVRGCIFQATLVGEPSGLLFGGPAVPDGEITLAEDWDFNGIFFVADADSVVVQTTDSAGTATDYSFHLTVHC
ncbi:MAG: S-layer homology domain-containing protein [Acidimicrobiales bacterium]